MIQTQSTTVNSRFVETPLLPTPAITDKTHPPGESYRGLTENDCHYYGLSNNVIVLTLDKADTLNLYNLFMYQVQFVVHRVSTCINTLPKTSGVFISESISWHRTLLVPFPSRLII